MKKGHAGFILLMTICTLLVISVLVLFSMQQVIMYRNALNRQLTRHQNFYCMEDALMQIAEQELHQIDPGCVVSVQGAGKVIDKLVHNAGCLLSTGGKSYTYLVEDLGYFPCQMVQKGKKFFISRHLRVTLLQSTDEYNHTASVMQVRVIKGSSSAQSCPGERRTVLEGVNSWRYLPDV
ncbi:hypothetical protein [Legionella worsleiensis]|uniref:Tfp pilus assembly protein PilX n=1 Tax=Legionella worsleiensis TaxID=45076 RepID=A0A0W1AJD2_9GAMM|nr:hypothetical protein [Legionella worsleiensis]KTD81328.1 hypothetical protein Lwor_0829 [Legionella worsleiensis]STY30752.1 Uncharacterised protein [Legionella worsleiensis]